MRAIRVAIVDDEPLARLALTTRLARRDGFEVVAEYGDGETAAAGLLAARPDLVFMDIEMPGRSGIEVLRELGRLLPREERPLSIMATAYDGFALPAFDLAALDYLLKPIDDERLDEALARARLAVSGRRIALAGVPAAPPWVQTFSVRQGARTVLVRAADVEFIDAEGDYATLHANGKTYLLRERLHLLAARLDPALFQRVHRSTIVRLDRVAELRALSNRDALLRLRDGNLLRASRTYMPALMAALDPSITRIA